MEGNLKLDNEAKSKEDLLEEIRQLKEEKLKNERLLLRTVIDNLPATIYCKDLEGRKTLVNRAELIMIGAKAEEEVLGKTDFDFYPKEIAEGFFADDQLVIQKNQPVINREEYLIDKNGEKRWLLTSKIPMLDDNGIVIGLVGIGRDVTDRVKISKEIQLRNEQLTQLNAEKDKFFSIIAHDLKSPFTGLLGLTELMVESSDSFTKEEFVEYSKSINKASKKLYKLLENLLEWAQVQRGTITFTPINLDLAQIVAQSIDTIYQRALQKKITIVNEITSPQTVYIDEKMTQTVLRNLLSNAVKFTKSGGRVFIRAESIDEKRLRVSVEDTGVGIPKEDIERLFRIEQKVCSLGTEGESSTGLGLLLCKEFVEIHGGRIWVESETGKGSKFSFTVNKADS
jgi:PAS domain S-box-containing protein